MSVAFRDRLFDGYGPLHNFAAKIDLAHAFGIVPKQIFDDLRVFNRIRNRFVHATKTTTFQDPEIVKMLSALSGKDGAIPDMKTRLLEWLKEIEIHLDGITGAPASDASPAPVSLALRVNRASGPSTIPRAERPALTEKPVQGDCRASPILVGTMPGPITFTFA